MPQLDQISTFSSQIFWFFFSLGIIYFFVSKFASPKLVNLVDGRKEMVASELERAESFREDAKKSFDAFERRIMTAKYEAQDLIFSSSKQAENLYNEGISSAEHKIKEELELAEKDIKSAAAAALDDLRKEASSFVEEILKKLSGPKIDKSVLDKVVSKSAYN